MTGIRVAILLILNPEIRVGDITVENVLSVFGIGFEISRLNLFANKFSIFRDQIAFQELKITFRLFLRELFTLDLLFQDVEQMHRVRRDFGMIKVKDTREDLKRETRRQTVHSLINPGVIPILLIGFRFWIGIFQTFAIVNTHLRVNARVLRFFQARKNGEARERFQRAWRARRMGQLTVVKQFLVDFDFFGDPQAIRHFDNVNTVKERLIVFVVAERYPFGLVRVGKNNSVKRQGRDTFRPVVVSFLGGGQQRVQHFNRCLKHLYELHNPLVSTAQRTRVTVGVRIVLGVVFEFTNIHFPHQRRDILVIFITRFCFGDSDLLQNRRPDFDDAEFRDVPAKIVQAFRRPWRHDRPEIATRDPILFFQDLRVFLWIKQA